MTLAAYAIPIVIPFAAPELGMAPESVGFITSLTYATAMVAGLVSGPTLAILGPTRVFQAMLILVAIGSASMASGTLIGVYLGAIAIGCATGPMNPSGSHVLARVTNRRNRAMVFSIKQCGTPTGGMLAGALLPPLIAVADWQTALLLMPVLFACLFVFLAPVGRLGGPEPDGSASGTPTQDEQGVLAQSVMSIREALVHPGVRAVTLTGLGLAVCQMGLATYLVVFLWQEAGYSPAQAGLIFSSLHVAGIASRIVLGALADRLIAARWILAGLGVVLAMMLVLVSQFSPEWPVALVSLVIVVAGASGNGWVGLFYAELARLAPPDRTASITGGSQFIMYIGIALGPLLFNAILALSDSYTAGFLVLAALSLLAGLGPVLAGRKAA
jgi:MFS family permease